MAMAARRERGLLDPDAAPGQSPFDHHVYVFASDGDIEEGVSHEVSSLAAHQQLGNLVLLYDDNQISIEDDTNIAKSEDVLARYAAYGWHTQRVGWRLAGGYHEDVQALYNALVAARDHVNAPSIIGLSTIIGRSARLRSQPRSRSWASTRRSRSPSRTRRLPGLARSRTAASWHGPPGRRA